MARFILFHQHLVSVCKLVSANYCFQVKFSFEDSVIASILLMVVMLPTETQFLNHLSIPSSLQLHSTTARFPLSFVILVLIIWLSGEKVYECFQKTGESL